MTKLQRPRYPPETVRALLQTSFVTEPTRRALRQRLERPVAAEPRFFDARTFAVLQAACARLLPQPDRPHEIDLAGGVDERLARLDGDGWRYDALPSDGDANRRGLAGIDAYAWAMFGSGFTALDGHRQDVILGAIQQGQVSGEPWSTMSAPRFFEELLAELVEGYYSHPLVQEEIGYVGMADAHGWHEVGLGQLAPHEPRPLGTAGG